MHPKVRIPNIQFIPANLFCINTDKQQDICKQKHLKDLKSRTNIQQTELNR